MPTKKPLTKIFKSPLGNIKAVYDPMKKIWKLYRRLGASNFLQTSISGTEKTTEKELNEAIIDTIAGYRENRMKNPVIAKKPLTKEFISHAGYIKAIYHAPIGLWKLYKRFGTKWRLLGAVRGTAKTTDRQLLAKLPKPAAEKKTVRKKNPLKKYVFFVGPEFPDTEQGKKDCLEFGQRSANRYGVTGHVYKA